MASSAPSTVFMSTRIFNIRQRYHERNLFFLPPPSTLLLPLLHNVLMPAAQLLLLLKVGKPLPFLKNLL